MTFTYDLAKFIAFRDLKECKRVRAITREQITQHSNPEFKIRVIEHLGEFYGAFATDIVMRIQQAHEARQKFVGISRLDRCHSMPLQRV
jgi:glucosamine-6-phosphate deaminase